MSIVSDAASAVVRAVRNLTNSEQEAVQKREMDLRQRYIVNGLRKSADGQADPKEINTLLASFAPPLTPDDFEHHLGELLERREDGRSGREVDALQQEVDELGARLAEIEADKVETLRRLQSEAEKVAGSLSEKNVAIGRAQAARQRVIRTSPLWPKVEALLKEIAVLRQPAESLERVNSLRLTANLDLQRAEDLDGSPDHAAQPLATAARDRAKAAKAEIVRIEKLMADIEPRERKLRDALAVLEAECIEAAILGELPVAPAAPPVEQPGRVFRINM